MTKEEALRLALEALVGVLDDSPKVLDASISGGLYEVVQCRDAITAIKEALETKDEPMACAECGVGGGHALYCVACAEKHVKRKWVGLTDKEQMAIAYSDINCWDWGLLLDATEAKLKEKNT